VLLKNRLHITEKQWTL